MIRGLVAACGMIAALTLAPGIGQSDQPAQRIGPAAQTGVEDTVLAESLQKGPIAVGTEPGPVPLGDRPLRDVISPARRADMTEKIYVVLDNVHAKQQPGILFEILIGVLGGNGNRSFDHGQLVGHLNFFRLEQPLISFDVTGALRELMKAGLGDRYLAATIQPAVDLNPAAQSELRNTLEDAAITVARIRLVMQRNWSARADTVH